MKRTSYWIVSNASFKIRNLKVCNLAEFCRNANVTANVTAMLMQARKKKETFISIDGWKIEWSYSSPLLEVMAVVAPNKEIVVKKDVKRMNKYGKISFANRQCLN